MHINIINTITDMIPNENINIKNSSIEQRNKNISKKSGIDLSFSLPKSICLKIITHSCTLE